MVRESVKSIVIGAGGTGGHIFPAIAVAQALQAQSPEVNIHFIGVGSEIEHKLLDSLPYTHHEIAFRPVVGKGIFGLIRFALSLPQALWRGVSLYRSIRPSAVICFGGYPSFIPMLAATVLRLPRVLHEQNVKVGLANKALSLFAKRIFAARGAKGFWGRGFWSSTPVVHLSNPVREKLSRVPDLEIPTSEEALRVFIMGGSQGAVSLNSAVLELAPFFLERNIKVIHQTGKVDFERVTKAYQDAGIEDAEVYAFIEDIEKVYSQSHLIICRAGAMTVAEVSATGRPAIYVPLPISSGHQKQNVLPLLEAGAARMEEHGENLVRTLQAQVDAFLKNPSELLSIGKKARAFARVGDQTSAELIAAQLLELSEE